MSEWFEHLPGVVDIAPIAAEHLLSWPDAAFARGLRELRFVPVAESELQLAAHHLLLGLRKAPGGWEIGADLREPTLRRPTFSSSGEWQLGYRPLALRLLPFVVSSKNQIYRLLGTDDAAAPNRSRQQMESVQKHLMTLYGGRKRAAERVSQLLARGWVDAAEGSRVLHPDLATQRPISVTSENWDPVELLLVLEFSQKQRLGAVWPRRNIAAMHRSETGLTSTQAPLPNFLDWDDSLRFAL